MKKKSLPQTARLLEIMHRLRKECPWDKKQTHRTLTRYLIEEAYEVVDAIDKKDKAGIREELGDLLLQIVFHSEIASEKGGFTFEEVAKSISDKMVRRHPQIYSDKQVKGIKEHLKNWTKLKEEEKPDRGILDGIPLALPALQLAQRYGDIAATVGFDWPSTDGVLEKVVEEVKELRAETARKKQSRDAVEMEFGDVLFTLTRLAAHLKVDAEAALRKSAAKFASRLRLLEKQKKQVGKKLTDFSLRELEQAWQENKFVE